MESIEHSNRAEKRLAGAGVIILLLGVLAIGLLGWKVVGGLMVGYGALTLFLAYHLGVAPCWEDLESELSILGVSEPKPSLEGGRRPVPSEWLTDCEAHRGLT
jgi:hypothetical protein